MPKELPFYEKTILATPDPIHSSSMTSRSCMRKSLDLNDIPERDSDIDDSSFGILSIHSDDVRLSDASRQRLKQREKAQKTLQIFSKMHSSGSDIRSTSSNITSIPAIFLQPSEMSECSTPGIFHSESTISESDLLPGNCSTPRESLFREEYAMKRRPSQSASVSSLAASFKNHDLSIEQIMSKMQNTVEFGDSCFQSGAEALAKLEQGEISWKKIRNIPAGIRDFSFNLSLERKESMGNFFKQGCDDLITMLPKSPQKPQPPIPLIEDSVCSPHARNSGTAESLGITDIQNILQSDESTGDALDKLFKNKPNSRDSVGKQSVNNLNASGLTKATGTATKENISPEANNEKSIVSSRSSSSLSSLPSGKLPIATTKTELIWGCVKLGKTSSHDFVFRNRSGSRVGVLCTVSNPSYRLTKDGTDTNFSGMVKLVLHPYELRSLTVLFTPTALGAAVDNLSFTPMDPSHKQTVKQFIRLYGYGGHANVLIQKIVKDTAGKFLISLGNIDEEQEMKQNFVIKNNGSLAAFTYFYFISHGLHSFSNVGVYPKAVVLLPDEEKEIVVKYTIPKADFNYIKSTKSNNSVIDIGKLHVVHGAEIDRSRLRKMCQKAKEKGLTVKPNILDLVAKFPGEVVANDLKLFRESTSSTEEILRCLNSDEVIVTLQQNIDQTIIMKDESTMFQSLCENTTLENSAHTDTCQIEPSRIILTPPDKVKDRILLINNSPKTLYFEVCSIPEGLFFRPKDGTIKPVETLAIDLQYTKQCDKTEYKVRILVDHDSFEVDVKIVFVGRQ